MFSFSKIYLPYSRRTIHDIIRSRPIMLTIRPTTRTLAITMTIAGSATKKKNIRNTASTIDHKRLVSKDGRDVVPPIRT